MRLRRTYSGMVRRKARPATIVVEQQPRQRVQTKLRVGAANDAAERQADRTAQLVLSRLERGASSGEKADAPPRREDVRPAAGHEGVAVDATVEREIASARRGGRTLDAAVQQSMGVALDADLSDVRVHTDAKADSLNQTLNARAFTIGNDIFFGGSQFQPKTRSGQELLAHELAHTVQQRADTASRTIQRWVLNSKLDMTDAISVKTIKSGQSVFFLEDVTHDTVVVKGDNVPVGMNQLFSMIHQQVSGTQSVSIEPLPIGERATLKYMISAAGNNPSWDKMYSEEPAKVDNIVAAANPANLAYFGGVAPTTPRGKAQLFHMEQLDQQPKLVAMSNAATGGATDVANVMGPDVAQGSRNARQLFRDPEHMRQLGMVTATDLFLGNTDRVMSSNFGNWFVDPAGAMTLLDNLDPSAKAFVQGGDVAIDAVKMLDKKSLERTSARAVNRLVQGMVSKGDTTAADWANNVTGGKTMRQIMEAAFLKGLKDGKARIIKTYATDKMGSRGRAAKARATGAQMDDAIAGDNTTMDYWAILKARARWLKAH